MRPSLICAFVVFLLPLLSTAAPLTNQGIGKILPSDRTSISLQRRAVKRPTKSTPGAAAHQSIGHKHDRYFVMVKEDGLERFLKKLRNAHPRADVADTTPSFDMFSGNFDTETVKWLRAQPEVLSMGQPSRFEFLEGTVTQHQAPLNLVRLGSNTPVTKDTERDFIYDSSAGACADIYIVDSGIRLSHTEFDGRAIHGSTYVGLTDGDQFGHGTLVASIAAGKTYGVAKRATVFDVKVGSNPTTLTDESIVQGLIFIDKHAKSRKRPTIVNISVGGKIDGTRIDVILGRMMRRGYHIVVAAGNGAEDASTMTPARVRDVITVGNIDQADQYWPTSNFGQMVDIHAPGVKIVGAGISSDTDTAVNTGTSFSAPLVSGMIAYLSCLEGNSKLSAADMKKKVMAYAHQGVIGKLPTGTRNRLLHMPPIQG